MEKQAYYNYNNLPSYLEAKGIAMPDDWLRWFKDVVGTKISMFEYDRLPGSLTSQITETALMYNNFLCMWKSDAFGVVLCRYRFGGEYDLYWKPVKVNLLTLSGQPLAFDVPYEDIVPVRDNPSDIIPFVTLNGWVNKILDIERTMTILIRTVRLPTILVGDKEQAGMLKELMKKTYAYDGFAVGSKNFKSHVEQFDIKLPVDLETLYDLMQKYKNLALNSIGIYGADEKRERLITAEIQATNDFTDFIYAGMLHERKRWIKECNEKFGTDIAIRETYVENQLDDLDIKSKELEAEAQSKIEVEKVKNEGKVEASKVSGVDASKVEAKAMKEGGTENER